MLQSPLHRTQTDHIRSHPSSPRARAERGTLHTDERRRTEAAKEVLASAAREASSCHAVENPHPGIDAACTHVSMLPSGWHLPTMTIADPACSRPHLCQAKARPWSGADRQAPKTLNSLRPVTDEQPAARDMRRAGSSPGTRPPLSGLLALFAVGAPKGIRIPVAALKGLCPGPLDDGGSATILWFSDRLVKRQSRCETNAL
jgi:hypothetical protein